MSQTHYEKFKSALARLAERHQDYQESLGRSELRESDRESIKESCIQRFEVCFDIAWKHLKKYLEESEGLAEVPSSPNGVFKKAFSAQVIDDVELWMEFGEKRGATSHDYSGSKADETFSVIADFIPEAISLYETMSGEAWQT